jgi:hypothetical protein
LIFWGIECNYLFGHLDKCHTLVGDTHQLVPHLKLDIATTSLLEIPTIQQWIKGKPLPKGNGFSILILAALQDLKATSVHFPSLL